MQKRCDIGKFQLLEEENNADRCHASCIMGNEGRSPVSLGKRSGEFAN